MKHLHFLPLVCGLLLALFPLAAPAQDAAAPAEPATTSAEGKTPEAASGKVLSLDEARNKMKALSDAELAKLPKPASNFKTIPEPPSDTLVKFLTVTVLVFGLVVLGLMTLLIMKDKSPGQILRLFTVPLVVVAAIFLIVTGYSNDQIAPVIGLFGTLVGYILGANHSQTEATRAANEAAARDKV